TLRAIAGSLFRSGSSVRQRSASATARSSPASAYACDRRQIASGSASPVSAAAASAKRLPSTSGSARTSADSPDLPPDDALAKIAATAPASAAPPSAIRTARRDLAGKRNGASAAVGGSEGTTVSGAGP